MYRLHLLVSQTIEFIICIFMIASTTLQKRIISMTLHCHITSPAEKSRPETWSGNYMGKATAVWQ